MNKNHEPQNEVSLKVRYLILLMLGVIFISLQSIQAFATQNGELEVIMNDSEFAALDSSEFVDQEVELVNVHKHSGLTTWHMALVSFSLVLISAYAVRKHKLRWLRRFILLFSMVYLGFFEGGCPCVIAGFQNFFLWILNGEWEHTSLILVLGVFVLTYVFGKVWCGWVCHLGAFQEFLFQRNNIKILKNEKIKKTLKWTRIILFFTLILQLLITRENLFIHIDPFKVAFNLSSYYITGWILLAILMISSVYIYRPFCQGFCPVGLVLSWIDKIPGASIIQINSNCKTCGKCQKVCLCDAIQTVKCSEEKIQVNSDCLMCGNCLEICTKDGINFSRKRFY
jgi:polyferredoxin